MNGKLIMKYSSLIGTIGVLTTALGLLINISSVTLVGFALIGWFVLVLMSGFMFGSMIDPFNEKDWKENLVCLITIWLFGIIGFYLVSLI